MKYSTVSDTLVVNISYSTASNECNFVASDVSNTTASYASNPICFEDHNPTSSKRDSTVPNYVLKLAASKASNVTTLVSNLAAFNIPDEVNNSQCSASSLISNTFEGEFADLEIPIQLPSQTQIIAIDALMIIL